MIAANGRERPLFRSRHSAFTLFELILAIALSVTLLALIGTAINLYLLRVDAGRSRVEEAQLARSVLAMIADDLRATAVYKSQDTSGVASLVAASGEVDVDAIADSENFGSGSGGGPGTTGTAGSVGAAGGATSPGGDSSGDSSGGVEVIMPLGLNGTLSELYVDTEQLLRMDELFLTTTGYTNAQSVTANAGPLTTQTRPSNVKTVRYFIRQGRTLEAGSAAITSLAPDEQLEIGGLVRQQLDRPARVFAETIGDRTVLDSGQAVVAPEVVHIEFRYFDGSQILDYWDMTEKEGLPPAVEVRIWLTTPDAQRQMAGMPYDAASLTKNAREYRQIVFLPMSAVSGAAEEGDSGSEEGSMGTAGGEGAGATGGSTSGTGSGFDSL